MPYYSALSEIEVQGAMPTAGECTPRLAGPLHNATLVRAEAAVNITKTCYPITLGNAGEKRNILRISCRKSIPYHRPPNNHRPPQIFPSSRTLKGKRREETRTGN